MVSHSNFSTLRCSLKLGKITVKIYMYISYSNKENHQRKLRKSLSVAILFALALSQFYAALQTE